MLVGAIPAATESLNSWRMLVGIPKPSSTRHVGTKLTLRVACRTNCAHARVFGYNVSYRGRILGVLIELWFAREKIIARALQKKHTGAHGSQSCRWRILGVLIELYGLRGKQIIARALQKKHTGAHGSQSCEEQLLPMLFEPFCWHPAMAQAPPRDGKI